MKKVRLCADVNLVGAKQTEVVEVADDVTAEELDTMARDFLETSLEPQYWVEEVGEDEDE